MLCLCLREEIIDNNNNKPLFHLEFKIAKEMLMSPRK